MSVVVFLSAFVFTIIRNAAQMRNKTKKHKTNTYCTEPQSYKATRKDRELCNQKLFDAILPTVRMYTLCLLIMVFWSLVFNGNGGIKWQTPQFLLSCHCSRRVLPLLTCCLFRFISFHCILSLGGWLFVLEQFYFHFRWFVCVSHFHIHSCISLNFSILQWNAVPARVMIGRY